MKTADCLCSSHILHPLRYLQSSGRSSADIYLIDWLVGLIKYRNGQIAYYEIRAEREAYDNDEDEDYLSTRKRWAWLKGEDNTNANV